MRKRICVSFVMLCLLIPCIFTGCSGGESPSVGDVTQSDINLSGGFQVGQIQDGGKLYVTDSRDLSHREVENYTFHFVQDQRTSAAGFFTLQYYYDSETDKVTQFVEEYFNDDTETVADVDPKTWDIFGGEGSVESFDVTEDGFVFLVKCTGLTDEDGAPGAQDGAGLVYTDRAGGVKSWSDLTDALKQQGIFKEIQENPQELYCDGEGVLYLVNSEGSRLYTFTAQGEKADSYSLENGPSGTILSPVRDNAGRLFFPVNEDGSGRVLFLGRDENGMAQAAVFDDSSVLKGYVIDGANFYYADGDGFLIQWDVVTGQRERVTDMSAFGLSEALIADSYMTPKDGELKLRICMDEEDYVLTLSDQEPQNGAPVRLCILTGENDGNFLNTSVVDFCRKHPQYTVTLESADGDDDAWRKRILSDISAGNGPDILCVSQSDMKMLADAGELLPMDEILSADTLDALLPGVIGMGTYGGGLMGIAPQVTARTLMTRSDIWDGEGWTLDDVMGLAGGRDGLESIFMYSQSFMSAENILYDLVGRDLGDTRFLDMENGVSRFESENFADVLETVRQYSERADGGFVDGKDKLGQGACLAEEFIVMTPWSFYKSLAEYGEMIHAVGFPTDSGSGSYLYGMGMMAVNAEAKNKEAVSAFMEYLFSVENQSVLEDSLSVRQDMADRLVKYEVGYDGVGRYLWQGKGWNFMLESRADGSTFTEEYNNFLKSCVPAGELPEVYGIVEEEAGSFFSGDNDAITAVRSIDNRVQLYLDEKR